MTAAPALAEIDCLVDNFAGGFPHDLFAVPQSERLRLYTNGRELIADKRAEPTADRHLVVELDP